MPLLSLNFDNKTIDDQFDECLWFVITTQQIYTNDPLKYFYRILFVQAIIKELKVAYNQVGIDVNN